MFVKYLSCFRVSTQKYVEIGDNTLREWVNFGFATIRFVRYYNPPGFIFSDEISILNSNDNVCCTNMPLSLLPSTVSRKEVMA